jgi:hypothetical protein
MNKLLVLLGILMLLGGLAEVIWALNLETSVPSKYGARRINNIGLMADRQNGLITGFGFAFLGTAFVFAGHMLTVMKGGEDQFGNENADSRPTGEVGRPFLERTIQGRDDRFENFRSNLNRQGDLFLSRAKAVIVEIVSRSNAAAHLSVKQVARTKIATLDLPRAFTLLGRHLYAAGTYREQFATLYQQIDKLSSDIAAIEAQAASSPKPQGVADKAKATANTARDFVEIRQLHHQADRFQTGLGKAAFELHGEASGSEEYLRPITECLNRIQILDAAIASLSLAPPRAILTPKRIAIVGVFLIGLVMLVLIGRLYF